MPSKAKRTSQDQPNPTYSIRFKDLVAIDLLAKDRGGTSDPYLQIELLGGKQKVSTHWINNSLNPVWKEQLSLDGSHLGNDVLKFTVLDHDMLGNDDAIGSAEVVVRELALGVVIVKELPLVKNMDGKPVKKASPGSGGTLKFKMIVQKYGTPEWVESPWKVPLHTAHVVVVGASDVPTHAKSRTSDPFVVVKTTGLNEQKTKTKTLKGTTSPTWNEEKTLFINDIQQDFLTTTLYHSGSKDEKLADAVIPISDFKVGEDYTERTYRLTPANKKYGQNVTLTVRVKVDGEEQDVDVNDILPPEVANALKAMQAPPKAPPKEPPKVTPVERSVDVLDDADGCHFQWGVYSSSYSTDLTGYSQTGSSLSKSHGSTSSNWHHHDEIPPMEERKVLEPNLYVKGIVEAGRDLVKADADGTNSYVKVEIASKLRAKKELSEHSKIVANSRDPEYNFEFDFGEVPKIRAVVFTVYQHHDGLGDYVIGTARKRVKDIDLSSKDPVEIKLEKPMKLGRLPAEVPQTWGLLTVVFLKDSESKPAPHAVKPAPHAVKPTSPEVKPAPQAVKPAPQAVKPAPPEVKPAPQEVKPAPPIVQRAVKSPESTGDSSASSSPHTSESYEEEEEED